jgi:hypothetical protein
VKYHVLDCLLFFLSTSIDDPCSSLFYRPTLSHHAEVGLATFRNSFDFVSGSSISCTQR